MNPIESAVSPLIAVAVERARTKAEEMVQYMIAQLEAVAYDLDKAAPYPGPHIGRPAYMAAVARRNMFLCVFRPAAATRRTTEPFTVSLNTDCRKHFVDNAGENAAAEYDAFVAKLNTKIGEAVSAELVGNHVWGSSKLYVTKADGTKECWKTQMIINTSKLGKLFNQFPTRKVKA